MRRFHSIGIHSYHGKKTPPRGVQSRKSKRESLWKTSTCLILVAVLLLVPFFTWITRYGWTRNGTASNDATLEQDNIALMRNTNMQDDNTHEKHDGTPKEEVNDAISPDEKYDGTSKEEANDSISPDENEVATSGDIMKYEHNPYTHDVNATQQIFGRPSIQEDWDLSQCLRSPLDPSINDTIDSGWGCDVFHRLFYDSYRNGTKPVGSGYWRDVFPGHIDGQDVALKVLRKSQDADSRNIMRHKREASIMVAIHEQFSTDESHVVPILGLCGTDSIAPLMEFTLKDLIFDETEPFPFKFVVEMAIQAAKGVRSLHTVEYGPVVHTDIEPNQFLFDDDGNLLLNDLNRCRIILRLNETVNSTQNLRGREREDKALGKPCPFKINASYGPWRSPEEYQGTWLNEKLDIYSLGVTYWVMMTRDYPNAQYEENDLGYEQYHADVINGYRLTLYENWHPDFKDLLKSMWAPDADDRPDADTAVKRLEDIYETLEEQ